MTRPSRLKVSGNINARIGGRERVNRRQNLNPEVHHPEYPFVVKPSDIHRNGLFTKSFLPANFYVLNYTGSWINAKEAEKRMKKYRRKTSLTVYFFKVNAVDIIDSSFCGNDARFINHSCDSNLRSVQVGSQLRLITTRDIEAGEEVTFDYSIQADGNDNFECQCGAVNCRSRF